MYIDVRTGKWYDSHCTEDEISQPLLVASPRITTYIPVGDESFPPETLAMPFQASARVWNIWTPSTRNLMELIA